MILNLTSINLYWQNFVILIYLLRESGPPPILLINYSIDELFESFKKVSRKLLGALWELLKAFWTPFQNFWEHFQSFLRDFWEVFGSFLASFSRVSWELSGSFLEVLQELFETVLRTSSELLLSYLGLFWEHSRGSSKASWQPFENIWWLFRSFFWEFFRNFLGAFWKLFKCFCRFFWENSWSFLTTFERFLEAFHELPGSYLCVSWDFHESSLEGF